MFSGTVALRTLAAVGVTLTAAACGDGTFDDRSRASRESIVYGEDDRVEPFASEQPAWLVEALDTRLLALGAASHLSASPSGAVTIDSPSLQQRYDLCQGERFAEQPSFAHCSAVIVSSRHVITAAHCTRAIPIEQQVGVSRFYIDSSERLRPLSTSDIHAFERVIARDDYWDYAWLELAEPVAELAVATLGSVEPNDAIASIAHGAGLPAKVMTSSAAVVDDASILSTLDAFGGASGGPIFSAEGALVGVLTSGAPDYERTSEGCLRASKLPDARELASELALRSGFALEGLCRASDAPELCPSSAARASPQGCAIPRGRLRTNPTVWLLSLAVLLARALRHRSTRRLSSSPSVRARGA